MQQSFDIVLKETGKTRENMSERARTLVFLKYDSVLVLAQDTIKQKILAYLRWSQFSCGCTAATTTITTITDNV